MLLKISSKFKRSFSILTCNIPKLKKNSSIIIRTRRYWFLLNQLCLESFLGSCCALARLKYVKNIQLKVSPKVFSKTAVSSGNIILYLILMKNRRSPNNGKRFLREEFLSSKLIINLASNKCSWTIRVMIFSKIYI